MLHAKQYVPFGIGSGVAAVDTYAIKSGNVQNVRHLPLKAIGKVDGHLISPDLASDLACGYGTAWQFAYNIFQGKALEHPIDT